MNSEDRLSHKGPKQPRLTKRERWERDLPIRCGEHRGFGLFEYPDDDCCMECRLKRLEQRTNADNALC